MRSRLLSLLVLLMTAVTGAWAADKVITWDQGVIEGIELDWRTNSFTAQGVTISKTGEDTRFEWGSMEINQSGSFIFSSSEGNIKGIVITSYNPIEWDNSGSGWSTDFEPENGTLTWSGTPTDEVVLAEENARMRVNEIRSIVFTIESDGIERKTIIDTSFEEENSLNGWTLFMQNNWDQRFGRVRDWESRTGDYVLQMNSWYNAPNDDQYVITPELNGDNLQMVFYARSESDGGYSEHFKMGYSTTDNNFSSFTWGDDITVNTTSYQKYSYDAPAGTKYIAVKLTTPGCNYFLLIDDLTIKGVCSIINYDANGGSNAPVFQTKRNGASITLTTNTPTRTGYSFAGWNTAANGTGTSYAAGATYSTDADLTLYAQWTVNTYAVRFNKNAEDATGSMDNQAFNYGGAQGLTANAYEREGYTFNGWNTDADGNGTAYTDGQNVSNLTAENNAIIDLYAQWTMNVVETISLDKTELLIEKGQIDVLTAICPDSWADKSVTWKTSNKKIATVEDGLITGIAAGTVTITCTSNETGQTATCQVTVGYVKLTTYSAIVEKKGKLKLKATVYPKTLTDKSVIWESSNPSIATVVDGKIKGKKDGTAIITCTSVATGLSASCEVIVGYVSLSQTEVTLTKGEKVRLKAKVYPKTLEDLSVTWECSDPTVVRVISGQLKGLKPGTATVTCTSNATGLKAICEVTVTAVAGARSMDGDDTTGIDDMNVAVKPFDAYDLSGRKVLHQATSLDALPKGAYIVNGKKVVK